MLDTNIIEQLRGIFGVLENRFELRVTADEAHEHAAEMRDFVNDFCSTSEHLSASFDGSRAGRLEFELLKNGEETGVKFRGIPNGHEFTSLIMAVVNADGKGKNLPDDAICRRIRSLKGDIRLQTYVSLTCTNCPDVVQALNLMAILNPRMSSEMVDGALFEEEVSRLNIQAVPSVYANGEQLHIGRGDLGVLLQKLEDRFGSELDESREVVEREFDVVVLGGGPAGTSAAIYSARKGLRVALVAGRIGGQVKDTVGIENLISVPKTTGAQLADDLRKHLYNYPVEVFDNRKIDTVDLAGSRKRVHVKGARCSSRRPSSSPRGPTGAS